MRIDLNSDLGEGFGPWTLGDDAAMMAIVTSANIACGGHAGDPETMFNTLRIAAERGTTAGAHPGFVDREGFGRRIIPMSPAEIARLVAAQVGALCGIASLAGTTVRYVKPHGALGNLAAADRSVAEAVVTATASLPGQLGILAISGTELEHVARAAGIPVFSEIFADRTYQPNGQLLPRSRAEAVIHDPVEAAQRILGYLGSGLMPVVGGVPIRLEAHSICVHGDTAGAIEMARIIRAELLKSGYSLLPFMAP